VALELRKNHEVSLFYPAQAKAMRGGYDLYLCVDDGTLEPFSSQLHPSAMWVIDSHTAYLGKFFTARRFDYVFTAQKDAAERFAASGMNAFWLPLACYPPSHGKVEGEKVYDFAFVGGLGWGPRKRLLKSIKETYSNSFLGGAPATDLGAVYSKARVVFNCSVLDDLNMRVFEGLCSGTCLLTNDWVDGQDELFKDGEHLVTYRTPEDAILKMGELLKDPERCKKIVSAGRELVLAKHTYEHRVGEMLRVISERPIRSTTARWYDAACLKTVSLGYRVKGRLRKYLPIF